jgi:hypothetical protein
LVISLEINSNLGVNYLYVDNILENYSTDFYHGTNSAAAPFVIGGTVGDSFEGRLFHFEMDSHPRTEPLPGTTYCVQFQYKPDTYFAEWMYTVSTASNPIQYTPNLQPYAIAGDFIVSGSDVEPGLDYIQINGSTYAFQWNKYNFCCFWGVWGIIGR